MGSVLIRENEVIVGMTRYLRTSSPCQCPASPRRFGSLFLIAERGHARYYNINFDEQCIPNMLKQLNPVTAGLVVWAYNT